MGACGHAPGCGCKEWGVWSNSKAFAIAFALAFVPVLGAVLAWPFYIYREYIRLTNTFPRLGFMAIAYELRVESTAISAWGISVIIGAIVLGFLINCRNKCLDHNEKMHRWYHTANYTALALYIFLFWPMLHFSLSPIVAGIALLIVIGVNVFFISTTYMKISGWIGAMFNVVTVVAITLVCYSFAVGTTISIAGV
ncbi:MAG: hypothetical protein WC763_07365 [Candidatus Paceibacterota bacterium]|jgi:hypothetical protein